MAPQLSGSTSQNHLINSLHSAETTGHKAGVVINQARNARAIFADFANSETQS